MSQLLAQPEMADFDRSRPLFERLRVPCNFVSGHANAPCPGKGKQYQPAFRYPPSLSNERQGNGRNMDNIVNCTIRILSGRRPLSSSGGGGLERCIRFEITDECAEFDPYLTGSSQSTHQQHAFATETMVPPAKSFEGAGISDHFPPLTAALATPPVMMQQPRHPPQSAASTVMQCPNSHMQYPAVNPTSSISVPSVVPSAPINTYELEVGETDFAELRRDQALLVDFGSFADSFIALLGYCDLGGDGENSFCANGRVRDVSNSTGRKCSTNTLSSSSPTPPRTPYSEEAPQYNCRLEDFTASTASLGSLDSNVVSLQARFSIVESNQFRELTHLSLNLRKGSDATVRSYLTSRLHHTMAENSLLNSYLWHQTQRAENAEQSAEDTADRLRQLALISEAEKRKIETEAAQMFDKESSKQADECRRSLQMMEDKIQMNEAQYKEERIESQRKIEKVENESNCLSVAKSDIKKQNDDLRGLLVEGKAKIEALTMKLVSAEEQAATVCADKTGLESSLNEAHSRIAELEQSNSSRSAELGQSDASLKAAREEAVAANDRLTHHSKQLEEARARASGLEAELRKCTEMVGRYKRDRAEMKRKIKGRSDIARKQEEALTEKEEEETLMNQRIQEADSKLRQSEEEKSSVQAELTASKAKISELQTLLESNQQVITWLNKEINDTHLQGGAGGHDDKRRIGAGGAGAGLTGNVVPSLLVPNHHPPALSQLGGGSVGGLAKSFALAHAPPPSPRSGTSTTSSSMRLKSELSSPARTGAKEPPIGNPEVV